MGKCGHCAAAGGAPVSRAATSRSSREDRREPRKVRAFGDHLVPLLLPPLLLPTDLLPLALNPAVCVGRAAGPAGATSPFCAGSRPGGCMPPCRGWVAGTQAGDVPCGPPGSRAAACVTPSLPLHQLPLLPLPLLHQLTQLQPEHPRPCSPSSCASSSSP